MAAQHKDVDIVELLRAEPKRGFEVLYQAYAERLFAYCTTVLRDRDSAADASHECLVAAVTKIDTLRSAERLRPWLFAIARNECFKLLRGKSREVASEEAIDLQSTSPDLAADVTSSESQQLVYEALQSLAPADRDVLAIALRNDLDAVQVAEAMEMSSNQVRARLSRARAALTGAVSALVLVRDKKSECPDLAEIVAEGDSEFTPLLRKRISRHIKECETCEESSHKKALSYVSAFTLPLFLILPKGFEAKAMESVNEVIDQTGGNGADGDGGAADPGVEGAAVTQTAHQGSNVASVTEGATGAKKVALGLVAAGTVAAGIFAFGALVPTTETVQPSAQQAEDLFKDLPSSAGDISSGNGSAGGAQRNQGQEGESGNGATSGSGNSDANERAGNGSGQQSGGGSGESSQGNGAVGGQSNREGGNTTSDQSTGSGAGSGKDRSESANSGDQNTDSGGASGGSKNQGATDSPSESGQSQNENGNGGKGQDPKGGNGDDVSQSAPQIDPVGTVAVSAKPGSLAGCPNVKWSLSAYTKGGPVKSVVVYYGGAASGKVALSGGGSNWNTTVALPQGIYKFYAVAFGEAGNKVQSATQSGSVKCPPADTQPPKIPTPKMSQKFPSPKLSSPPNLNFNQG